MYKYKKERQLKETIKTITIVMLLGIILLLLYNMYINIDVTESNYKASKLTQTISTEEIETKNLAQTIEKVSECVVGISKLQNNGSSIFLTDSEKKLAIGSGIIITENGYILSNQHVTGNKYSNCYVTLSTGAEYNATVIWEDEAIDLSIIKINARNLPYATIRRFRPNKSRRNCICNRKSNRI